MIISPTLAERSIDLERVARISQSHLEEASRILANDRKSSFETFCEAIREAKKAGNLRLYHQLLKALT